MQSRFFALLFLSCAAFPTGAGAASPSLVTFTTDPAWQQARPGPDAVRAYFERVAAGGGTVRSFGTVGGQLTDLHQSSAWVDASPPGPETYVQLASELRLGDGRAPALVLLARRDPTTSFPRPPAGWTVPTLWLLEGSDGRITGQPFLPEGSRATTVDEFFAVVASNPPGAAPVQVAAVVPPPVPTQIAASGGGTVAGTGTATVSVPSAEATDGGCGSSTIAGLVFVLFGVSALIGWTQLREHEPVGPFDDDPVPTPPQVPEQTLTFQSAQQVPPVTVSVPLRPNESVRFCPVGAGVNFDDRELEGLLEAFEVDGDSDGFHGFRLVGGEQGHLIRDGYAQAVPIQARVELEAGDRVELPSGALTFALVP